MSLNKKIVWVFLFSILSFSTSAAHEKYFLIAPHCLLDDIHTNYKTLAKTSSLSMIATNNIESFIDAKHRQKKIACGGFRNVTQEKLTSRKTNANFLKEYDKPSFPSLSTTTYRIQYPDQVNYILGQLDTEAIWDDLTQFSDTSAKQFPDRYMQSGSGTRAATWLENKAKMLVTQYNRDDVSIDRIPSGTLQDSVVMKIGNSSEAGIVIGAHMDTHKVDRHGLKPGADDDGSGCMTVMSIARTLLQSGMHFKKPVYLIWYAAEEFGLIGSQAVAKKFVNEKIPVAAVLQFDMTGYMYPNDDRLWLVKDNVDPALTDFLALLIKTYVKKSEKSVETTLCGYACSDHASWSKYGIPAAFPFESSFLNHNKAIHTAYDIKELLSRDHMADYAKLGLAFAVEMAEPMENQ